VGKPVIKADTRMPRELIIPAMYRSKMKDTNFSENSANISRERVSQMWRMFPEREEKAHEMFLTLDADQPISEFPRI
jgi:hypothetical protein